MLSREIRDLYLVDELQLHGRLNEALQEGSRAEFSLLLAMLSTDVTDQPVFKDPEKSLEKNTEDLRARFGLGPGVSLYAKNPDDFERAQALTECFAAAGARAVNLQQCLHPDPLTPFKQDLAPDVVNDLPPLAQEKVRLHFAGEKVVHEPLLGSEGGFAVLGEIRDAQKVI